MFHLPFLRFFVIHEMQSEQRTIQYSVININKNDSESSKNNERQLDDNSETIYSFR